MPIGGSAYGRAKQRHSTAALLSSANPVPAAGEFVQAIDGTDLILKQGDGVRGWNALPTIYPAGGGGGSAPAVSALEAFRTGPSATLVQTPIAGVLDHYRAELPSGFDTYDPYDGFTGYGPSDLSWVTPGTDGAYVTIENPCWYSFGAWAYVRWTADPGWVTFAASSSSGLSSAQLYADVPPQQSRYAGAGTDFVYRMSMQTGPLLSAGGEVVEFTLEWGDLAATNIQLGANFTLLQTV